MSSNPEGVDMPAMNDLLPRRTTFASANSSQTANSSRNSPKTGQRCQICTVITATTVAIAIAELREAFACGADIVELRLDFLMDLDVEKHIVRLLAASRLPVIATCRPEWEGGQYKGDEAKRLAMLNLAAVLGAQYIDIELKAAPFFFAGAEEIPSTTKVIMSYHDFEETPDDETLDLLLGAMRGAGCHIAKIAANATDISDSFRMLRKLQQQTEPTILLSMGERGLPSRILAPKFGGFLTFGSLRSGAESAPGQPTVQQLREMYRVHKQSPVTQVYGVVGNPISHSRSPALHNAALAACGIDGVYLPLLVDDFPAFLATSADINFVGLSVTIPHKGAALGAAQHKDPVAEQIGAANTLIGQSDGSLAAYNTDWSAAISAIEGGLTSPSEAVVAATLASSVSSPLQGRTVLVVGAGGAGRAIAFGAAEAGAKVLITNRSREKAEDLAKALGNGSAVVDLEDVNRGSVTADVLVNTTSVGMHPNIRQSPIATEAISNFGVVFDAIYTPLQTQLLKDAQAAGCVTISGLEMFVGQAADQFRMFTGQKPPVELMRQVVLDSLG